MIVYLVIYRAAYKKTVVILRTALSYTHFSKSVCVLYVRTCEVCRCTLDHLASLSEKKVAVGEKRGAPHAA